MLKSVRRIIIVAIMWMLLIGCSSGFAASIIHHTLTNIPTCAFVEIYYETEADTAWLVTYIDGELHSKKEMQKLDKGLWGANFSAIYPCKSEYYCVDSNGNESEHLQGSFYADRGTVSAPTLTCSVSNDGKRVTLDWEPVVNGEFYYWMIFENNELIYISETPETSAIVDFDRPGVYGFSVIACGTGFFHSDEKDALVLVNTNPVDNSYPIIRNLNLSSDTAAIGTPITVSGTVDGNGGTVARVRISVFYNETLTEGKVYKDFEVNNASFDLSTIGELIPGTTLAQDGSVLIPSAGNYRLAVFATNTNGNGQGDSPALISFAVQGCSHPNYGYTITGKGETVKVDDNIHRYTFPVEYYCTTCNAKWNGEEYTENSHLFIEKVETVYSNDSQHLINEYSVCSSGCGATLTSKKTVTESHAFDENGECDCGYKTEVVTYAFDWTDPNNTGVKQLVSTSVNGYTDITVVDAIVQAIANYDDLFLGQINGRLTGMVEGSSEEFIADYYTKQALANTIGDLYVADPRYNNNILSTLLSLLGVNGFKDLMIGEDELKALEETLEHFVKHQKDFISKLQIDDTEVAGKALDHLDDLMKQLKVTKDASKLKGIFGKVGKLANVTEAISALFVTYQIYNADMSQNLQALKEYRAALVEGEKYAHDVMEHDPNVEETLRTIDDLIYDYEHLDITAGMYAAMFISKQAEKDGSSMVHPYLAAYNAAIGVSGSIMKIGGLSDDSEAKQLALYSESVIVNLMPYMVKIEEKILFNEQITAEEMDRYIECVELCYNLRMTAIDKLIDSGALSKDEKAEVLKYKEELQKGLEMIERKEFGIVK